MTKTQEDKKHMKVKLVRSTNKKPAAHKACVIALGLKKIGQEVEIKDTPENRGIITRINYLLKVS
jgi:large subunit ribosomal protein L30